jgi:hypothetical protein
MIFAASIALTSRRCFGLDIEIREFSLPVWPEPTGSRLGGSRV